MFPHTVVNNGQVKSSADPFRASIFAYPAGSEIFMRFFQISVWVLFLWWGTAFLAIGQSGDLPFTCFNAFEIHYPLERNDFARTEITMDNRKVNALYYLYQDKYTFWYKLIVHEETTIDFSVTPSNEKDKYRALAFKYGGADFCDKFVNRTVDPVDVQRSPIFEEDGRMTYRNTIEASAGDTFYISVLSLNGEDCGHRFYTESRQKSMTMHAVHQPCYNFVYLDVPDFSQARMPLTDISLDLDYWDNEETLSEQETEITPENATNKSPKPGYGDISSIEVESEDKNLISVGDRLILNEVYFYNNTYAFKPGADKELDELVAFLVANPTIEIEVQGHSANNTEDIRPDPNFKGHGKEWNFKGSAFELSEKRAEAVRNYLVSAGINKNRLTAKGYGDTRKRVPEAATFEEFEKNMRVEALVIKQ